MGSNSLLSRASEFAARAHAGQKRKYDGSDYITHCEAVVAILRGAGVEDDATLAAAWLHDVCEDCGVSLNTIREEFREEIGTIVKALTDCAPWTGNRAARKALDRERLSQAPAVAQTIKLADLIDNTASIVERDPDFAVTYMREKALLLPLLTKADEGLRRRAGELLAAYEGRSVQDWLKDRPHA